jgi:hypothetical protein
VCRHKEQLEKAREQLEKVKAAAGIEAKDDMQARIQRAQKVLPHSTHTRGNTGP